MCKEESTSVIGRGIFFYKTACKVYLGRIKSTCNTAFTCTAAISDGNTFIKIQHTVCKPEIRK